MLVCSLPIIRSFPAIIPPANSRVDTDAASGATVEIDAAPASNSVFSAPPQSSFSPAPDFSLDNEMWGDFGLGLSDNWDMPGSGMSWIT
jgi:hypothetical protein